MANLTVARTVATARNSLALPPTPSYRCGIRVIWRPKEKTQSRCNMTDRALLQRIRTLLSRQVREEMNLLYTEPVQETPRGCDFGLFCREHAYTTYLLGRMNGLPVELILGHYFVRSPSGSVNVTLDSGADPCLVQSRIRHPSRPKHDLPLRGGLPGD